MHATWLDMHDAQHRLPKVRSASGRRRRFVAIAIAAIALVLCAAGVVLIPPARTASLRLLGETLVAEDPVAPADAIVVTVDAGAAGLLEAADLVRAGVAEQVAFFVDPARKADTELRRRGVADEDSVERSVRQLQALGVRSVEPMPEAVLGSEDEGEVLAAWCGRRGLGSVVVVSGADHSRRLRRVFHRAMKDHPTRVSIRIARFSAFEAGRWWETRGGLRTWIIEFEKLVLDVARHPIS